MYECLFYNGWVDPPGYELLEVDTSKFGRDPQEILANPEFKKAVEKCMKMMMVEDIDWDCIYLLNPDDLVRMTGIMGCQCQECGRKYTVDLSVPDDLWERIKPKGKPRGAGLLCGACIMNRIESLYDYEVIKVVMLKH